MTRKRTGRRRWAKLTRFLEQTMMSSGSERTRMQAAMRLSEVLIAREQKETAELRAAARKAEAPGETAKGEAHAEEHSNPPDGVDLDAKAAAIFGPLVSRGNDASASQ